MPKGIAPDTRTPKPDGAQLWIAPLWLKLVKGKVWLWQADTPLTPENNGIWLPSSKDADRVRELIKERNYDA